MISQKIKSIKTSAHLLTSFAVSAIKHPLVFDSTFESSSHGLRAYLKKTRNQLVRSWSHYIEREEESKGGGRGEEGEK